MSALGLTERLVFERLLQRSAGTIPQLAEHLAIPGSTVASAIERLRAKRLLTEGAPLPQGRGRPSLSYRARLPGPVAAVLVEASAVHAALFDTEGQSIATLGVNPGEIHDADQAVALVGRLLSDLAVQSGTASADVAYLALVINAVRTPDAALSSSVLPWASAGFADAVQRYTRLPASIVTGAAILAEYLHLPEPAPTCMMSLSVGDGVSCHTLVSGQINAGRNALSGELGHVTLDGDGPICGCGRRGCIESFCSGPAICRRAQSALADAAGTLLDADIIARGSAPSVIDHIFHAWRRNDLCARSLMAGVFDDLAWTLSIAVNLYDPELVRVRGYVLHNRQPWIDEVVARARQRYLFHGPQRQLIFESGRATVGDLLRTAAYRALFQHHPMLDGRSRRQHA